MKKNFVAIETAVILILIGMVICGLVLGSGVITFLSIGLLLVFGVGLTIYKIIMLALGKETDLTADFDLPNNDDNNLPDEDKKLFSNTRKAWHYSTNGEKIKSIMFILTFLIACVVFLVLCSLGYLLAGFICLAVGIALIIIAIIAMALIEKFLIKQDKIKQQKEIAENESLSEIKTDFTIAISNEIISDDIVNKKVVTSDFSTLNTDNNHKE